MKAKLNQIAKWTAVGIFFIAMLINVKVSLTDPFLTINNELIAQTTTYPPCPNGTSNSYGGLCCKSYNSCPHPSAGKIADASWKSCQQYCS